MAVTIRTRFEVFKRDGFACQYCGRKSPEVVLQIDHIVPVAGGGSDDLLNLRTSCWECNSGKSDTPLSTVVTGEDPYERSIMLLERERQLREYNSVLAYIRQRRERDRADLLDYWEGYASPVRANEEAWLLTALDKFPTEMIRSAMDAAIRAGKCRGFAYVNAVLRNQRDRMEAA